MSDENGASGAFTQEQKSYLEGFVSGIEARRAGSGLPGFRGAMRLDGSRLDGAVTAATSDDRSGPEDIHRAAQDRFLAGGKKLTAEEAAKRKKNPLDMWDELGAHAAEDRFPGGMDVFLFKFHGLFYVAPAQNAFMCRLRIPNGILSSHQMRGLAELADRFGGGYADVTTRANLQIREIRARDLLSVLTGVQDLGLHTRGAGADNIRNITGTPTAGIDVQELIDTRPMARELHHYILHHRELYGLPRKFNIAFDGGGTVSSLEDTNDIGFAAVRSRAGSGGSPGVGFRVLLGGITGHGDFACDSGILLEPRECVPAAAAMARVFIEHGDRTDRKKARLKYLLERWGVPRFLEETENRLGFPLRRVPGSDCEPRGPVFKHVHVGFHSQKQAGLVYAGVVLPVGRMTGAQMRSLASTAEKHGSATIRLTVWQNVLISDIPREQAEVVTHEVEATGLGTSASNVRAGLVACTGNRGCRYSSTDTKAHALEVARHVEARVRLDEPVNIHFTGCPHSCAQHYIGDIGLLGTKVQVGEEMAEGYHVFVGGGYGAERSLGREVYRSVPFPGVPALIERMLRAFLERRVGKESFREFVSSRSTPELLEIFDREEALAR